MNINQLNMNYSNNIHYLLFDLPNRVFPCLNQFATTVSYSESVNTLFEFALIIPINNNFCISFTYACS